VFVKRFRLIAANVQFLLLALFRIGGVFALASFIGDGIVSEGCILVDGRCFIRWRGGDIIFLNGE